MNNILIKQIENIDCNNLLSYLCNCTAVINEMMHDINWVGFYFYDGSKLQLGPFQGKIACTPLTLNKGVCAKSFVDNETVIVKDVHAFEGHIACDSNSKSEIVIPLIYNNECFGVLDIDSPKYNRFNNDDKLVLEGVASIISMYISRHYDTFSNFI